MSEINLNEEIDEVVDDATVMTVPIDDTLSVSGEAADAAAVGAALALKADASSVHNIKVNDQEADNQGLILLTGEDVPVSESDTTTLAEAIAAASGRTAADIVMSDEPEAPTLADKIGAIDTTLAEEVGKTGEDIPVNTAEEAPTIAEKIAEMDEELAATVKSVNNATPDEHGNVTINKVPMADNLDSSFNQNSTGEFIIRTTGGSASVSDGPANLMQVRGNSVLTGRTDEVMNMSVNGDNIEASITDKAAFREEMGESGTLTLTYTTDWSADPDDYGITVTGTPENGDSIVVQYVKEIRGTITNAHVTGFSTTGWNLYDQVTGYARVVRYSDEYGYAITGTYTKVEYSATADGTRTNITPASGILFSVPGDGYVFVTGGSTDTAVWATWSDWTNGYKGDFAAYSKTTIDLSTVMGLFPDGLCAVGNVRDYIDLSGRAAYKWIDVMGYNAENRAAAESSGRPFIYDENYIYLARAGAVITSLTGSLAIDNSYAADDHGLEMFEGTAVPANTTTRYGIDLRNRLERDVLTISQQTLTAAQKSQVQENIGAISSDAFDGLSAKVGNTRKIHFFKAESNLAVNGTATYQIPEISDYNKCFVISAGLYLDSIQTNFPTALDVQTVSASGITVSNSGGAPGKPMLCIIETT